jgi:hypothetical protein
MQGHHCSMSAGPDGSRSKSREGEGSFFTEIEITTGLQFVMSNNIEPSLSFQLVPTVPIGRMVSWGMLSFSPVRRTAGFDLSRRRF